MSLIGFMNDKIFDNSNIAESYAGVTTPLTFSFVRYVYQEVYTYFCEMMGADAKTIKNNRGMFEHMVEFVGCRIYYNLGNWYRMLSFFPGYKFSSRFMEKMMGVEEELSIEEVRAYSFWQKYLIYLPKTLWQILKISMSFLSLGLRIKRFNKYFDNIFFKINSSDLKQMSPGELKNLYIKLDKLLISRWKVPIANDFAVMVSAGLADKLFQKWLKSNDAYSYMRPRTNKPLASLDPGNEVLQIVEEIKKDAAVSKLFIDDNKEEDLLNLLYSRYASHKVSQRIDNYLKEYGCRMPSELKLESETLTENPTSFIKLLRSVIRSNQISFRRVKKNELKHDGFRDLSIFKRLFLMWLLKWVGNSIQRREEARLRRALIFGFARKIFIAIGVKLKQDQLINNTRDIFFLTIEEVFGFVENNSKSTINVLNLIEQRKKQHLIWENVELPRRIETNKNLAEIENDFLAKYTGMRELSDRLTGRVASHPKDVSVFSGIALTLINFDPAADFKDKILVTRQTDPGWTMIFPLLKGLVVERGGMLSHAAIVARELNIPCIVGVENATGLIQNGMNIKLDLQNGLVHTT